MTRTEFSARYRILRQIAQDGARSYTAQHLGTQRPVMVHFLDLASSEVRADMLARLDGLDATDRARIVERLEVDGAPVVVTQILSSFESLPSWLSSRARNSQAFVLEPGTGERAVPVQAEVEALRPAAGMAEGKPGGAGAGSGGGKSAGEFTRMFGAASEPARMELGATPAPSPVVRPPAAPAPPAMRVPEAYTPVPPPSAPPPSTSAPSSSPDVPSATPSRSSEPGEFTRMFRPASPRPARPQSPPSMPPASSPMPAPPRIEHASPLGSAPLGSAPLGNAPLANAPMANAPMANAPLSPPRTRTPISGSATGALDARPIAPEPPKSSGPSERAKAPSSVPLDFPPPLPPSFAQTPGVSSSPLFAPSPPQAAPASPGAVQMSPSAPPLPHGPSEFTRVIAGAASAGAVPAAYAPAASPAGNAAAPAPSPAAAPGAAATPAPAGSAKESQGANKLPLVPLLLALNLIVLVAVGLVVYFALKS